jgi:hypothetical protein
VPQSGGWINVLSEDMNRLRETNEDHAKVDKSDKNLKPSKPRIVFAKERPTEPYRFIGVFMLDSADDEASDYVTAYKRIQEELDLSPWLG